jgi:hypothetical protein
VKKVFLFTLGISLFSLLSSCHLFDDNTSIETVAVFFNETNVSVFEGGLGSVSLKVEPPDVLEYNNVLYSISNEEVAMIYRADKRGCVFVGRSEGSTVLSARIKNAEAKMVITVLNK